MGLFPIFILLIKVYMAKKILSFVFLLSGLFMACNYGNSDLSIKSNKHLEKDSIFSVSGKKHFRKGNYYYKKQIGDSAAYYYSRAVLDFKEAKDSLFIVKSTINLAIVQAHENNFIGSDATCIEGLKYLNKTKNIHLESHLYNRLGLNATAQRRYQEAQLYYAKISVIYNNFEAFPQKKISFLNNIGLIYQKQGFYTKAIAYFDSILDLDNLQKKHPIKFARALDNKAWSLYLNQQKELAFPLLQNALQQREKLEAKPGLIMSHLHLSHYFIDQKKSNNAQNHAQKAYDLCLEIDNPRDKLEALLLLVKSDSKNAVRYFEQHKKLQDSLIQRERSFKDQTAKIRYETAQKEEQISIQKQLLEKSKKSLLLGTVLFGLLSLITTAFYIQKNKIGKQKRFIENLQKELHHRSKGNLRHINTFISVAKEATKEKEMLTKLDELQNRISSMFEIHQQLHQSKNVTQLNLAKYIGVIGKNMKYMFNKSDILIIYDIDKNLNIIADKSFALGLIINEFLTNSFKYAFTDEKGKISIILKEINQQYHIELSDNGIGLSDDFKIEKTESFGMRIIKLLVEQLNGTFALDGTDGVKFNIQIPK